MLINTIRIMNYLLYIVNCLQSILRSTYSSAQNLQTLPSVPLDDVRTGATCSENCTGVRSQVLYLPGSATGDRR